MYGKNERKAEKLRQTKILIVADCIGEMRQHNQISRI
jgi:hypothetical protein